MRYRARRLRTHKDSALPIPLQIVACLLIGLGFGLAAHRQAAQGRSPFSRDGWAPIFFQVILVTPALAYLGAAHPAWSWLYLVEPTRLPFGMLLLSIVAAAAAMASGYLSGWAMLKARRVRELLVAMGVLFVGLVVTAILMRVRLSHAGTFAEWTTHIAAPLASRKLGFSLVVVDIGLVGGLALAVSYLVAEGQRGPRVDPRAAVSDLLIPTRNVVRSAF